jgi:hypothetical protein
MRKFQIAFVIALSVLAFGCKKKAASSGDCATAINRSMELSKAEMKEMGTDDKMMQKMADLGIQHCKDDKWSADVIKCMNDAKTMADSQACYGKLTPEQQEKMNKAAMELAAPAAGSAAGEGAAGSAAPDTGSAAGSAAGGAGSAADPAAGSAGSAAPAGSAAAPK